MTVHRFWHGDSHPPYPVIDNYVAQSYDVRDWTLNTVPNLIELYESSSRFIPAPDQLRHISNIARLLILVEHGGIWLDHDVLPLTDLESFPRSFAASDGGTFPSIWSCLLAFQANHPTLHCALDSIKSLSSYTPVPVASGSQLLNRFRTPDITLHPLACDAMGLPSPQQYSAIAFHLSATSHERHRRSEVK